MKVASEQLQSSPCLINFIIPETLSSEGFSNFTFTYLYFPSTRTEFSTVNTSSFDYLDNHLQQSL